MIIFLHIYLKDTFVEENPEDEYGGRNIIDEGEDRESVIKALLSMKEVLEVYEVDQCCDLIIKVEQDDNAAEKIDDVIEHMDGVWCSASCPMEVKRSFVKA